MLPPPQVQYDGCILSQRDCYIQKPCAVGVSNSTKRYIFNILCVCVCVGSDDKHSPYIYITEHQSTPTTATTYRSGHIATQTPYTSLSHLKKISHQSEGANCLSWHLTGRSSKDTRGRYNFFFGLHSMNFFYEGYFFKLIVVCECHKAVASAPCGGFCDPHVLLTGVL